MKSRYEIILSGVGGQGLVVGGTILGEAATMFENLNSTLTTSYGVETRGTFTKSDVIISKDEIFFPEVVEEDFVLALAQVSYDKYAKLINENCILVYDCNSIDPVDHLKARQYGFPITDAAREIGNIATANIISLGLIVKMTGVVSVESVTNVLKEQFSKKPKIYEMNLNAFNKGLEMAEQL
ncbi:2-oxoacid:acceptor oxidoreductase family protein [Sedimentibacter hydroxybenzoicus DSM 7310]|uniref:2-oxoacid:acceptor oxidoreductase family protein n=1 Tax=Sedimentibacter hydroxybenzoicus DSM 7310 TaxID=1123245 RepID=A0A974BLC1_SEDHY|nr:2-oxoacid:acceptor oxidoreductase family protein [Sedimentibacter hydroxybenzoicus]NYB75192.1 2-oxoacid:acceptor oxidoreductase family protein [Sedimentibacter hydroxybenzoicus DSM 7310]